MKKAKITQKVSGSNSQNVTIHGSHNSNSIQTFNNSQIVNNYIFRDSPYKTKPNKDPKSPMSNLQENCSMFHDKSQETVGVEEEFKIGIIFEDRMRIQAQENGMAPLSEVLKMTQGQALKYLEDHKLNGAQKIKEEKKTEVFSKKKKSTTKLTKEEIKLEKEVEITAEGAKKKGHAIYYRNDKVNAPNFQSLNTILPGNKSKQLEIDSELIGFGSAWKKFKESSSKKMTGGFNQDDIRDNDIVVVLGESKACSTRWQCALTQIKKFYAFHYPTIEALQETQFRGFKMHIIYLVCMTQRMFKADVEKHKDHTPYEKIRIEIQDYIRTDKILGNLDISLCFFPYFSYEAAIFMSEAYQAHKEDLKAADIKMADMTKKYENELQRKQKNMDILVESAHDLRERFSKELKKSDIQEGKILALKKEVQTERERSQPFKKELYGKIPETDEILEDAKKDFEIHIDHTKDMKLSIFAKAKSAMKAAKAEELEKYKKTLDIQEEAFDAKLAELLYDSK